VPVTLSIDVMSGDHGLSVTVPAALSCLEQIPALHVVLVGDQPLIEAELRRLKAAKSDPRRRIHHASEVVGMDEAPTKALRNKKDSSMRVAIDLVKDGAAQAMVSAGNTGALMATAKFVLKTLPGIDRPAIVSAIPSVSGHVHMLDLGANAECTSEQLFQFAVMGSALITAMQGKPQPRVALLNIGSEEIKGNDVIKGAAALLQASSLNYIGFVEGDGIFLSDVDLVVCDGFVGNVALKTGEGVAKMIRQFLKDEFTASFLNKLAAVAAMPALKALGKRIDPRHYNGASFLGLSCTVVKSHGGADAVGFANAIRVGVREVELDVPRRISVLLGQTLQTRSEPIAPTA
jgi:glycerol-3-phosphate acyltransferase PlsX